MPLLPSTIYPPASFYFRVQFAGLPLALSSASFQDASGLSVTMEPETYAEGGINTYRHRLPTAAKHEELVLKRGYVVDTDPFIAWCAACLEGGLEHPIAPQTLTVQLLSPESSRFSAITILRQWSFRNVWPTKWALSEFSSTKNEVLIETVHFAYSSFSLLGKP